MEIKIKIEGLDDLAEKVVSALENLTDAIDAHTEALSGNQAEADPEAVEDEVEEEKPVKKTTVKTSKKPKQEEEDLDTEEAEIEEEPEEKKKPAKKQAAGKATATKSVGKKPAPAITLDELRPILTAAKKAGFKDQISEILDGYGVELLSDLDEKYYSEVAEKVKALGDDLPF